MPTASGSRRRVALFVDDLWGGGMQKVIVTLASGIARRGHAVQLLTCDASGPLSDALAPSVEVVKLEPVSQPLARLYPFAASPRSALDLVRPVLLPLRPLPTLPYLPALARHLRVAQPEGLVSASPQANLEAVWARALARAPTRLLLTLHLTLAEDTPNARRWQRRYLPPLIRRTYPQADAIATVCDALGDEIAASTGLPRERIQTIYNPVVSDEIALRAREPVEHRWFAPGEPPVVLGVGRIAKQKDFPTLVRAFARLRARRPARLVILGEAKNAQKNARRIKELQELAGHLGVADDVDFAGFVDNPFAYMSRSAVFALSSRYEGFGNVLIEAMACGCPVVSTDCPVGPGEILEQGRYGPLVPVGDDAALALAIERTLDAPPRDSVLRARAADFSVDRSVDRYLAVLFGGEAEATMAAAAAASPSPFRSLSSVTQPFSRR